MLAGGSKLLGTHPEHLLPVYGVRSPFGAYIQLGYASDVCPRPHGCWLPSGWDLQDVTLETEIELLNFPRHLGRHPITGAEVTVHLQQSGATIHSEIVIDGMRRHAVTRVEPQGDVLFFTLERAGTAGRRRASIN